MYKFLAIALVLVILNGCSFKANIDGKIILNEEKYNVNVIKDELLIIYDEDIEQINYIYGDLYSIEFKSGMQLVETLSERMKNYFTSVEIKKFNDNNHRFVIRINDYFNAHTLNKLQYSFHSYDNIIDSHNLNSSDKYPFPGVRTLFGDPSIGFIYGLTLGLAMPFHAGYLRQNAIRELENIVSHRNRELVIIIEKSFFKNLMDNKLAYLEQKNKINRIDIFSNNILPKIKELDDDIPNILANIKPKQTNPKNWLIAIGTEKYDNTDEIKYSKNSTDGFVKVAQKTLGISERNTYGLIEEKSTSGAIKDNLGMLLKNVKDGDTIYFYYSGHGIPVLPDNEPYILPKDKMPEMIGKDDFFKLRNIYQMFSDSKAKKVVAIVDSCFSGATDGVSIIKGVAAARLVPKKVTFDKSKMVVLTAGKDKQYSNMYEEKGHRLFSYFVMKSLLKGKTNAKDIYAEVYTNVKDESFKMGDLKVQEPQIEGNVEMEL